MKAVIKKMSFCAIHIVFAVWVAATVFARNNSETKPPEGPFEPTWESLKTFKVPDWYQDAKFGIFIHWGLYSVPAFGNEWYPRNMYRQGTKEFQHHVKTFGTQSKFGYKDFIALFKAKKFDPDHWAVLFKKAGAQTGSGFRPFVP